MTTSCLRRPGASRLLLFAPPPTAAVLLATLLALSPTVAAAAAAEAPAPVVPGEALPALELKDQHGEDAAIDESLRLLLLTRDMDAGDIVKAVLGDDGRDRLEAAGAVYVSDVSGMPGFVLRMFAMPSLRKRPYPILLDEDGSRTARIPSREGRVTVLGLEGGRIASVSYAASDADLREVLGR